MVSRQSVAVRVESAAAASLAKEGANVVIVARRADMSTRTGPVHAQAYPLKNVAVPVERVHVGELEHQAGVPK